MIGDDRHICRIRCYEFAYIVPWDEIVESMREPADGL